MNTLNLGFLRVLLLILVLMPTQKAADRAQPAANGTLVVRVTWGDDDNTPANDVYVEAHGYVRECNCEKSFVLKSPTVGRYEASLPAGIYDVFVSESTSEPRSRRIRIVGGMPSTWTLKLEIDEVFHKN